MKTKLCAAIVAGTMAFPALAGYGKDDTQIMFGFSGGGNNARLFAEVLAQAERDRAGKPVAAYADRFAGHSAGAMLALFLTLPHHSDGQPLSANETLVHMGKHAPNILNTLMAGALQSDKAWVQAEIRKHLGAALGSSANLRASQLPGQVEVLMAEVVKDDTAEETEELVIPASFTAAGALSGCVPDATLAEMLTAGVSVERLAGHAPLTSADGKSARFFMDAGSRGTTDPTPNLIEAAMASGKPAHIFAFEAGFGFDPETVEWAEGTRQAEEKITQGLPLGDVDPKFARVRVHLFRPTRPEYQACAACSNADGKHRTPCTAHGSNLTRLVGESIPGAQFLFAFDRSLPLPILALNLQSGNATPEMNTKLNQIAHVQMIGKAGAYTPPYAKLLAVLAEADAAKAGSTTASAAVAAENKADGAAQKDSESRG